MSTAYVIVTVVTIVANAAIAAADFAKAEFVLANSAEVDVPPSWRAPLASLKTAGALGLLVGVLGVPFVGVAAAIGLVLYYVGAVATHVRARVFYNLAFAGGYLALAVASLVLAVAR
jgi:DoxX-like family